MKALAPQFQQQQNALSEQLAAEGIVGGSTAGAEGALADNQITQTLGQIAPTILGANQQLLGASEFNAGANNQGSQFNTTNSLNAAQYDTGTGNSFLSSILGINNEDYLAQLQAQEALDAGAAGGQTGSFQPVFQQPTPTSFSGLGGAFTQQTPNSSTTYNTVLSPGTNEIVNPGAEASYGG
jgi:hypothetical protein